MLLQAVPGISFRPIVQDAVPGYLFPSLPPRETAAEALPRLPPGDAAGRYRGLTGASGMTKQYALELISLQASSGKRRPVNSGLFTCLNLRWRRNAERTLFNSP